MIRENFYSIPKSAWTEEEWEAANQQAAEARADYEREAFW